MVYLVPFVVFLFLVSCGPID